MNILSSSSVSLLVKFYILRSSYSDFYGTYASPLGCSQNQYYQTAINNFYIYGCQFTSFYTLDSGSVVYLSSKNDANILIENSIFFDCRSEKNGGAVFIDDCNSFALNQVCGSKCYTSDINENNMGQFSYIRVATLLKVYYSSLIYCSPVVDNAYRSAPFFLTMLSSINSQGIECKYMNLSQNYVNEKQDNLLISLQSDSDSFSHISSVSYSSFSKNPGSIFIVRAFKKGDIFEYNNIIENFAVSYGIMYIKTMKLFIKFSIFKNNQGTIVTIVNSEIWAEKNVLYNYDAFTSISGSGGLVGLPAFSQGYTETYSLSHLKTFGCPFTPTRSLSPTNSKSPSRSSTPSYSPSISESPTQSPLATRSQIPSPSMTPEIYYRYRNEETEWNMICYEYSIDSINDFLYIKKLGHNFIVFKEINNIYNFEVFIDDIEQPLKNYHRINENNTLVIKPKIIGFYPSSLKICVFQFSGECDSFYYDFNYTSFLFTNEENPNQLELLTSTSKICFGIFFEGDVYYNITYKIPYPNTLTMSNYFEYYPMIFQSSILTKVNYTWCNFGFEIKSTGMTAIEYILVSIQRGPEVPPQIPPTMNQNQNSNDGDSASVLGLVLLLGIIGGLVYCCRAFLKKKDSTSSSSLEEIG